MLLFVVVWGISVVCYYNSISIPLALKGLVYQKYTNVLCTYLRNSEDHHVFFQGFLFITLPETSSSHLKMVVSSRNLLFQRSIFRCYVSFSEGKSSNPIPSMYGIFTYIYLKNQPNVGKYAIHECYGNVIQQKFLVFASRNEIWIRVSNIPTWNIPQETRRPCLWRKSFIRVDHEPPKPALFEVFIY